MTTTPCLATPHVLSEWMRITSDSEHTLAHKLDELLGLLRAHLALDLGIVSRIEGRRYDVFAVDAPDLELEAGTRFELASTYCERTISRSYVTSFHHAARDASWSRHPAYAAFALESYIGVSICVGEERFGTLNFSSTLPRKEAFSSADHHLVTITAQWIGRELDLARREEAARYEALMLRQSVAAARDHALRAAHTQKHLLGRLYQELHMPLRGIASLSMQLTHQEDLSTSSPRQRLEAIHTSSTHLLELIAEVLQGSTLRAMHHTPRAENFSLHTLLEEVATLLAPMAHQKRLYLDVCLEARLPDEVCGDPVRLRQVLMNLLGDCIARTDSGGIFLRCNIDFWDESSEQVLLIIDIQDTATRTVTCNVGDSLAVDDSHDRLGVEIARSLVEMLGGQLDTYHVEGHGVEKRIILPIKVASPSHASPPLEVTTTAHVVTDHDPLRMSLETSFARYGARHVDDPAQAQVCLMDADFPDVTRVIAKTRAAHPGARIYVLVEPERLAIFEGLHIDGLLDKPLRQRQLIDLFMQNEPPRHVDTQRIPLTATLSMEISVDDLELGQWLLPPSFEELDLFGEPLSEPTTSPETSSPARATLPDLINEVRDATLMLPSLLEQKEGPYAHLPVLDVSIYEEFGTHHEDALFLRALTREFFMLGARMLSRLKQEPPEERAKLTGQIQEMCNTSKCLGLLRVHTHCERIYKALPEDRKPYATFSRDVALLGELLDEAFTTTQERLKGELAAS